MITSRLFLPRALALALVTVAPFVSLAGCGGGGGGTAGGSALQRGRAALDRMARSGSSATEAELDAALELFRQAIAAPGAGAEAHFGAAVCLAGTAATLSGGFPETLVSPTSSEDGAPGDPGSGEDPWVPPTPGDDGPPPSAARPHRWLGFFWNLGGGLDNPYVLLDLLSPVTGFQYWAWPYPTANADDVARRQRMLAALDRAAEHLAAVEADPAFETTLPLPGDTEERVKVGLPEVFLFDAYVQSLRARLALSLAYVRETEDGFGDVIIMGSGSSGGSDGSEPGPEIWPPIVPWKDSNADGVLTPDEYLPAEPYLDLRDAALLTKAQEAMLAVADRGRKGIDGVMSRPADAGWLVNPTPEVIECLTSVRDTVLPLVERAATGPVTIEVPRPLPLMEGGTNPDGTFTEIPGIEPFWMEKVTVNVAAWFANPPPDLRKFAPAYPLIEGVWPDFGQAKYPDPTFAGLFPDGVPY